MGNDLTCTSLRRLKAFVRNVFWGFVLAHTVAILTFIFHKKIGCWFWRLIWNQPIAQICNPLIFKFRSIIFVFLSSISAGVVKFSAFCTLLTYKCYCKKVKYLAGNELERVQKINNFNKLVSKLFLNWIA